MARQEKRTRSTIKGFAATRDPRGVTKQAREDLAHGQQDTDLRGVGKRAPRAGARRKR